MQTEETVITHNPYWHVIWTQFSRHRLGMIGLYVIILFCIIGIYAPFLASSKPLVMKYDGEWYFPLFRYLFYTEFYTKLLDIFFNILIFTVPLMVLSLKFGREYRFQLFSFFVLVQIIAFAYIAYSTPKDPAADIKLNFLHQQRLQQMIQDKSHPPIFTWNEELYYMNNYAKINLLTDYIITKRQNEEFHQYIGENTYIPTLWQLNEDNEQKEIDRNKKILVDSKNVYAKEQAKDKINYIEDRRKWLETQSKKITFMVMPLIRPFHWEDDAGGSQTLNQKIPWWDLTRINRKDLIASLIFGTRISLVVGLTSVALALIIGIPVGAMAGFYGGKIDIATSRLLEIWESMPTFFMLLMVVAVTQSKSIFLVISVIGLFGWTSFSRYIRGEFFKQRNLSYVEACRSLGFRDSYIMFKHILPNAIPPLLTLLPFAIMAAITSEAGLSFLGLGEENSCSWGVLMDEGRSAFPGESYLLWPPAILLTIMLVAIALVGDALRDSLDPKMHHLK